MKNILLLTDFSDSATSAADYAVPWANALGCDITLYHVYQVYSTTGSFISVERYMVNDIENDMGKALRHVRAVLSPGLNATAKYAKGEIIPTLAKIAARKEYDLVVMGNHGSGNRTSIFWGTTTSGVAHKTSANLLAVPDNYQFNNLKNIVLIVDDEDMTHSQLFQPLVGIASAFKAKIWVYHDNPETEISTAQLKQALGDLTFEYYAERKPEESKNIEGFLQEKRADLVCMLRLQTGFWQRFFQSSLSVTVDQLITTPVPLLVLKDKVN